MLIPAPALLAALLLIQGTAPAPKTTWIADIKASQASLGTGEVRVQGDVVDIRSTSPTAKFGFYRLIDASDPTGLLVRTNQLPKDGGSLQLRARLAVPQPPDGSLLLDELERIRIGQRPPAATVLALVSVVSLIVLGVLLWRAAAEERRYKISPPLWLLPDAGPYGKSAAVPAGTSPPLKYSPDLEEQDRRQREQLKQRKHNLVQMTVGSFALTAASAAWLLISRPAAAQVPAFIFIEANDVPIPVAVNPLGAGDTALALNTGPSPDSLALLAALAAADSIARMPTRTPPVTRRDSARAAVRPTAPPPAPVRDSTPVSPLPSPAPVPAPAPAPAPPPPPPPPPHRRSLGPRRVTRRWSEPGQPR